MWIPATAPTGNAPSLNTIIPDNPNQPYDIKQVIASIVDNGVFFEPHEHFAQNIVVCFARLNGDVIGIIANQPMVMGGALDVHASDKATRFIRFCDAFNIPLLTLVDVPGYLPGTDQEWNGIIRHGAKLLWCYSEATVPKMTLITRKAYGGAYIAMCSKHLGADFVYAWPSAEIAVMGAEGAANIIHRAEIKAAEDPKAKRKEKIDEYRDLFQQSLYCCGARLCRCGAGAGRNPQGAHQRTGRHAQQARIPPGQKARQYSRVRQTYACKKPCRFPAGLFL